MRKGIFQKFKKGFGILLALAMIVSLITGIGTMEVKAEEKEIIANTGIQVDWSKVPTPVVGEAFPEVTTDPAAITEGEAVLNGYTWAVKLTEEHIAQGYVDRETYEYSLNNLNGWYNGKILCYYGYVINSNDTYGFVVNARAKKGYIFSTENLGDVKDKVTCNLDLIYAKTNGDPNTLSTIIKLGTLEDIEEAKDGKTPETKLAEAKPAAEKVITDLTATNATTTDDIINAVKAEVDKLGYGITVTMPDLNKNLATEAATGKITGTIKLTLDGKTVEVPVSLVIAKLPSAPTTSTPEPEPTPEPTAPGKVENNTNTKDNAFSSNLNETAEELSDKVLTKEEKEQVANGESAEVYLEVKDISDTVSKTDKEKVETAKGDAELGMYLDLSLYKKIGNDDPKKVANTNGTVTITIEVPTKLVNKDSGVTRTYQIVRVHNGKAEVIKCKYDAEAGTITFETDKFSTYALVYKDAAKSTGTNTNTNTNSNSSGTAGNSSTGVVKPTSPKTRDSSNLILWFALIVISGVAACYFVRKKTAVKKD